MAIIRFDAPPDVGLDDAPAYRAAVTSARQKVLNFTRLGCNPRLEELPAATSLEEFAALVDQLNQDEAITGIIVQLPVPGPLRQLLGSIAPEKDIDALRPVGNEPSPYRACATAEGIFRIVEPFALEDDQAKVAVVGSRGFVGGSVMQLLDDAGIEHVGLDRQLGDDLDGEGAQEVLHRASIVVSTANRPSILDKRHLTANHRLVVDSAYIPLEDGTVLSTVAESARNTPKNLTPVPGGTGPVEMAILMERVVRKDVDPALPRWYFNPGQTQIVTWGSPSVAPQVAAADSRVVELEARKREGTLNYRELRELEALKKSQRLVAEDPSVEPPATPTVTLDPEKPEQAP